ncbi:MAG: hypothetical protein Q7W30_07675 [Coriobacteriia bacterium]|nr:hypothetical protein [Coriobacteriia bacterium]
MPTLPAGPRESGSTSLPAGVRRDRIEPLWDRIDGNRVRVGLFLGGFIIAAAASMALLIVTAAVLLGLLTMRSPGLFRAYYSALPSIMSGSLVLGAIAGVVYLVIALRRPESRLLGEIGAVRSATGTYVETKEALYDMAVASGFQHAPWLWVIPGCDRINAFAVGAGVRQPLAVGITEGFAARLTVDDQRAVFANLMARACSGDLLWATIVSAVMGPIWRMRDRQLRREDESADSSAMAAGSAYAARSAAPALTVWFLFSAVVVVVTELLMAGHERAALAAAEKADAEGMLLLKDPCEMLGALERVLEANNTVMNAGEAYSMLFYCWAGFGFAPEDDPEMVRIARLREVLGAEGLVPGAAPVTEAALRDAGILAPRAPRVDAGEGSAS